MSKIVMIYASMTGNTMEMAEAIEEGIRSAGSDITVKEVMNATGAVLENFDAILLGAYT
jgi:flavodoxin I